MRKRLLPRLAVLAGALVFVGGLTAAALAVAGDTESAPSVSTGAVTKRHDPLLESTTAPEPRQAHASDPSHDGMRAGPEIMLIDPTHHSGRSANHDGNREVNHDVADHALGSNDYHVSEHWGDPSDHVDHGGHADHDDYHGAGTIRLAALRLGGPVLGVGLEDSFRVVMDGGDGGVNPWPSASGVTRTM